MNPVRGKMLAGFAAMLLVAASVAALAGAALWPLPVAPVDGALLGDGSGSGASLGDALPLSSFAPAWGVDLRRSLSDEPAAAPAGTTGSGSSVRLVGTIFDATRPRGIFVTNFGQMELRGVGEKAGGAEVLSVDERSATLMLAGRPVTLKVEKLESAMPPLGEPVQPSADAGTGVR